jgi:hypothetical protein
MIVVLERLLFFQSHLSTPEDWQNRISVLFYRRQWVNLQ